MKIKIGDKLKCKESIFLGGTVHGWLLKDRIYTVRKIIRDWVEFEEIQGSFWYSENDDSSDKHLTFEKVFYNTIELRKFKLEYIEKITQELH